jgi:hypothetical protein
MKAAYFLKSAGANPSIEDYNQMSVPINTALRIANNITGLHLMALGLHPYVSGLTNRFAMVSSRSFQNMTVGC